MIGRKVIITGGISEDWDEYGKPKYIDSEGGMVADAYRNKEECVIIGRKERSFSYIYEIENSGNKSLGEFYSWELVLID